MQYTLLGITKCRVQFLTILHRCEAFNSFIGAQNIYGNKHTPSRDICNHFAANEQLRYI